MIVRHLLDPPRRPGSLLFVPSLSVGPKLVFPPLSGKSIPTKEQFKAAFLNYHPNWSAHEVVLLNLPPIRPTGDGEVSPSSKTLLPGDQRPHPGEITDLLSLGYNYAKPFIGKALGNLSENYCSQSTPDRIFQGSLVLISAVGILGWSPSRSLVYHKILDGVDVPVCDWMTIAVGPKSLAPSQEIATLLPPPSKPWNPGEKLCVKITIDLSKWLQNAEATWGKQRR